MDRLRFHRVQVEDPFLVLRPAVAHRGLAVLEVVRDIEVGPVCLWVMPGTEISVGPVKFSSTMHRKASSIAGDTVWAARAFVPASCASIRPARPIDGDLPVTIMIEFQSSPRLATRCNVVARRRRPRGYTAHLARTWQQIAARGDPRMPLRPPKRARVRNGGIANQAGPAPELLVRAHTTNGP